MQVKRLERAIVRIRVHTFLSERKTVNDFANQKRRRQYSFVALSGSLVGLEDRRDICIEGSNRSITQLEYCPQPFPYQKWCNFRVRGDISGTPRNREGKTRSTGIRRAWGFRAHSRKHWLGYLSLCWQKRQQDSAEYKHYDHIGKIPGDAVNPGFHGLNSHHCAMADVPPGG